MKRFTSVLAVLALSAAALCAADSGELYSQFSDALTDNDAAEAIGIYDDLQQRALKELNSEQRRYEKAMDAGNVRKAQEALFQMKGIRNAASMKQEDSDKLLSLILRETDEEKKNEMAAWLYQNSPYYSPKVTYDWSADGGNVSYSFRRSISVAPGSEITLPTAQDIGADPSIAGVLQGWGVTRDSVTYQPGEVILAPYTSQTYYAIWKTAVVFEDELTGFNTAYDNPSSGDAIEVPVLTAPDSSYVFAGWVDRSNGDYISPDESDYIFSGNGASFEALWKKVEITDLSSPYDLSALPVNTQIELSFTLSNKGNENLRNSKVEITSDEGVDIQMGSGRVHSLPGSRDVNATGLRIVVTEPGTHDITVTFTDRDGDSWSESFAITAI